jgi:fused signal recognition particle receptor
LGFREQLREGLARTRERISASLGRLAGSTEPDWEELEETLLAADVGVAATRELLDAVRRTRGAEVERALSQKLLALLSRPSIAAPGPAARPEVHLVVGVNGVGKTTTVAKLAHRSLKLGRKPILVAADTFRAAAIEQLETWAARVGVDLVRGQTGADPAAIVHDGIQAALARRADEVIIDTAGRLHTKRPLMEELSKLARVAARLVPGAPHRTSLVMDATVGGNGLAQARHFREALGVTGIILTKLDGTAKGGIVVAVARELELPVEFTGVGEGLEDLVPFSPEAFVEALLGGRNGA